MVKWTKSLFSWMFYILFPESSEWKTSLIFIICLVENIISIEKHLCIDTEVYGETQTSSWIYACSTDKNVYRWTDRMLSSRIYLRTCLLFNSSCHLTPIIKGALIYIIHAVSKFEAAFDNMENIFFLFDPNWTAYFSTVLWWLNICLRSGIW